MNEWMITIPHGGKTNRIAKWLDENNIQAYCTCDEADPMAIDELTYHFEDKAGAALFKMIWS
jgi:hypothetical protein